jgi:hypothetical protein
MNRPPSRPPGPCPDPAPANTTLKWRCDGELSPVDLQRVLERLMDSGLTECRIADGDWVRLRPGLSKVRLVQDLTDPRPG